MAVQRKAASIFPFTHPALLFILYLLPVYQFFSHINGSISLPKDTVLISLAWGLLVGLPVSVLCKIIWKCNAELFADKALIKDSWSFWSSSTGDIKVAVPCGLFLFGMSILSELVKKNHLSMSIAFFAFITLFVILCYPDKKKIYQLAKAKLAIMRSALID